jgi:two-component system NtrC family sensor kinase
MVALYMGVGYIFSRRITSPLLRLVRGTRMVAAGDLDYRIEASTRDEIGQLMEAFNKMIAAIKENQRLARERELERQRVEEESRQRTKDLEMAELRARALQAENERKNVELRKSRELEGAYQELEESHRQLQDAQTRLVLQEKMASLGAMVAGVAHEINNPVGVVNSAVDVSNRCVGRIETCVSRSVSIEVLRDSDVFVQAVALLRQNIRGAREAGQRIAALVRNLKNFARLDEAEFQMADLHEGLDSTLALLHQQLGEDIEVKKEYGDIPRIYCSPGQINQVFMSVLRNAVQAIEGQGEIAIRTFREGDDIHLRIRDTGVGIPPERLEQIFEIRFSAENARVKMGSGLPLAYRIIQEHGGRIGIESEPGRGTEVAIRLPMRERNATSGPEGD